jgi:hypothetical protein
MRWLAVLPAVLLAACAVPSGPGHIEGENASLMIPPPPILIIPPPGEAMLADDAARLYAKDLADAFVALDVPAMAAPVQKRKPEWHLITSASLKNGQVRPAYAIAAPDQKIYGQMTGAPVDPASWSNGDPAALRQAAAADALALSKLLASVNATVQQSNPASLENRTPRVFLAQVTGAPGDGNNALALNMKRDLNGPDDLLVPTPGTADFLVDGTVEAQPAENDNLLVQIVWTVRDTSHRVVGKVTQLHELKPSDITPYWGDVAAAAAQEGAAGVQQVISNDRLHRVKTPAPNAGS